MENQGMEVDESQDMAPSAPKVEKPSGIQLMGFEEAVKSLKMGMRITKKEWDNPNIFATIHDEKLTLFKEDGKPYDWILSKADLYGEDWFII